MNDERSRPAPDARDAQDPRAALEAQRQRAARERIRLETEIDRLTTLLAERSDQLRRARADADRLRRHPVLRAYSGFINRLGPARPLLRRLRRSAGAPPGADPPATDPSEPPGADRDRPPPLDPSTRAEVVRRIRADAGSVDPGLITSLDVEVVVVGEDREAGFETVGDVVLAAAQASAVEWLVVLARTTEPAEDGWLARLVDGAVALGVDAATPRAIVAVADGSIQLADRGRAFDPGPGMPVPAALGRGEDAFADAARGRRAVVAPGDAAVLVRRTTALDLGAVDGRDVSEWAIELGIRLAAAGRSVAYVGDAVVWTTAQPDEGTRSWAGLHDRWAGRLHRQVWRSARVGGPWSIRPLSVALDPTGAEPAASERLRTALLAGGFDVRLGPPSASDIVIGLDPEAASGPRDRIPVRVAVVGDRRADWLERGGLDEIDIVVDDPDAVVAALDRWIDRVRWAIHIGPADWRAAATWGDTAFGRALTGELERHDVSAALLVFAERDDPVALRADVALHVVGTRRLPMRPGQLNLLWIISHPDAVRASICRAYDLVFVASTLFADHVAAQVDVPVIPLHQATDPERFFPEPTGPRHELLFVGNSRNRHRPVIDALAGTTHDLAIYGTNWRPDLVDPARVRGAWIPNDEVHRAYGAAAIVLNDHWPDMRDEGFLSNRLYDVLASGGFVLSDDVPGIEAEFDGGVATWAEPAELLERVDRYLDDPETRRTMVARGRAAVLARHTMRHRVDTLLAETGPLLERRPKAIEPDVSAGAT
jgi:hypothetical protein